MRIVFASMFYPVFMGAYFLAALKRRKDVELFTVGPYTGDQIPWGGGMYVKHMYKPDLELPTSFLNSHPPIELVEHRLPWKPDVWIQVDAGFSFAGKPKSGKNFIVGTDPHCVAGDTLLATDHGLLYAEELASFGPVYVAARPGMVRSEGVIQSGMKPTRTLVLEGNHSLTCTDDHLIEVETGFRAAGELRVGDKVRVASGTYEPTEGSDADFDLGFVIGAFHGDGNFGRPGFVRFCISKERKSALRERLERAFASTFNVDHVTSCDHNTCENAVVLQVRRWGLYRFLKAIRAKDGAVPLVVRKGSRKLLAGYFSGLLATDGCSSDGLLQITTKYRRLAREWQTILLYLGIPTSVRDFESNASSYKPGNKYSTVYVRAGQGTDALDELTGEIPGRPIRLGTRARGIANGTDQLFDITRIEGAVRNYPHLRCPEPVYDVTNTETNTFLANGISVHNCLNYDAPRSSADKFFCMQRCYAKHGDEFLPYGYDPVWHSTMDAIAKLHDACLLGLHYRQRDNLVSALRAAGKIIVYDLGPSYDDARLLYNQSRLGLNWSSLNDLNARAFELLAFGIPAVMNAVPDIAEFFEPDVDFAQFTTLQEAVEKSVFLLDNPIEAHKMARAGHEAVKPHTYDARIEQLLSFV